jgi:hypothetical protein
MLKVYYRNLSLYREVFFNSIDFNINESGFLIVENTTQKRAIELSIKEQNSQSYALYTPPVNRQGKEMCMGNRNHKIELRSTKTQILQRSISLDSLEFYQNVLQGLPISELMSLWQKRVGLKNEN